MREAIAVQFKRTGKIYDFSPGTHRAVPGDHVIVETSRGLEFATVVGALREIDETKLATPLREIIRLATAEDEAIYESNLARAEDAFAIFNDCIFERELEMKLVDVEYTFDNSKVVFYFTADGRVDFRELVKDLAAIFHTRIELRQIGVRDEAKIIGGIGICGRALCCHSFLEDFTPVSIKMAKEQSLSLNPSKISGCCGRLLCCLTYENDNYVEWHQTNPNATAADFSLKKRKEEEQHLEAERAAVEKEMAPMVKEKNERPKRNRRLKKEVESSTEIIIEDYQQEDKCSRDVLAQKKEKSHKPRRTRPNSRRSNKSRSRQSHHADD